MVFGVSMVGIEIRCKSRRFLFFREVVSEGEGFKSVVFGVKLFK